MKKEPDSPSRATIVLNATSEFCRALGDIPTYGQAGNREEIEKDELEVSTTFNKQDLIFLSYPVRHAKCLTG